ncbi:MAG: serine protease [Gemmataceae bacterium]|nr:serine protease [Gemmata sp.]MDW8197087.1 serine protease [Gemmataceae bacterium]
MHRTLAVTGTLIIAYVLAAPAAPPAPAEPRFLDDDAIYEKFFDELEVLAKAQKPLSEAQLVAKRRSGVAKVAPLAPRDKALSPEDVYTTALKSVFIIGSLYPEDDGFWEVGTYATAWVVAAEGVLVTNWHVFEDLNKGEVFGAADIDGKVYPLIDFLGGDKTADVAIFRIAAKGLTPLPVSPTFAEVGSWVAALSHPGDLFYVFTQGTVSRYSTNKTDDGQRERWMNVTAEFASGSSGAPILNKYGAVVGMASSTLSLEAVDDAGRPVKKSLQTLRGHKSRRQPPKKDNPPEKPKDMQPHPHGSPQQMVVKIAVPGPVLLQWLGK